MKRGLLALVLVAVLAMAAHAQETTVDQPSARASQLLAQIDALPAQHDPDAELQLMRDLDHLLRSLPSAEQAPEAFTTRDVEFRTHRAMAILAHRAHDQRELDYRMRQWRAAASACIAQGGQAKVLGDFWQVQADLFDLAISQQPAQARISQSIRKLEQFLAAYPRPDQGLANSLVRDVRLAVLKLYDQQGRSDKVVSTIAALREQTQGLEAQQLEIHLAKKYGYTSILNREWQAKLKLPDGTAWSSDDHHGELVLIHFFADWWSGSEQSLRELGEAIKARPDQKLAVISVAVAGGDAAPAVQVNVSWPIYREGDGQVNLSRIFHVHHLPRYVLIDEHGKVTAIGSSLSVLDQAQQR